MREIEKLSFWLGIQERDIWYFYVSLQAHKELRLSGLQPDSWSELYVENHVLGRAEAESEAAADKE